MSELKTEEGSGNSQEFSTHLEEFLAKGDRKINYYVKSLKQKERAEAFVGEYLKNYPDADIHIIISDKMVATGTLEGDRRIIAYSPSK